MSLPILVFLACLVSLTGCKTGNKFLVTECLIYDYGGKIIRQYDGRQCLFLKDGSWVGRDRKTRELFLKDAQFNERWRIKGHFHHTLNQLSDGTFLALASTVHNYKGKMTRFDLVVKIGIDGKIVSSFDFFEKITEIKRKMKPPITDGFALTWENDFYPNVKYEFSHANSAYEIPENAFAKKNSAFQTGNIIVHAGGLDNFFILDKNLQNILWTGRYFPKYGKTIAFNHDAQVLKNGNIALYVNQIKDRNESFSALVELDPQSLRTVWRYQANPKKNFSSEVCGGLEVLSDGNVLFTDTTTKNKIKRIARNGKEVMSFPILDLGYKILNVREVNLEQFFQNNSGL